MAPDGEGVLVSDVTDGSPAARAGLKRGDVILHLGRIPISSPGDYREALAEFTPSDRIRLILLRKGKEMSVRVKPTTFPLEIALDLVYRRLGIRVAEMDRATRRQYGLKGGVIIGEVRRDSEAGRIGLERGDLILKVHDMVVENLEDFKQAIGRYHHLSSLPLVVRRGRYAYSLTLPF
jgi:serine protease Do